MGEFRGTDETLEREIATLRAIARVRLRRYAREMSDLERDLRILNQVRARRKAAAEIPGQAHATEDAGAAASTQ
jgi:hypothetical protein